MSNEHADFADNIVFLELSFFVERLRLPYLSRMAKLDLFWIVVTFKLSEFLTVAPDFFNVVPT